MSHKAYGLWIDCIVQSLPKGGRHFTGHYRSSESPERKDKSHPLKVSNRLRLCGVIHQRCCDAYSRRPNNYQTVHAAIDVVPLQDSRQRQHGHPGTAEGKTRDAVCCWRFSRPRRRACSDGQSKLSVLSTSLTLEMQQNSTCGFQGEQNFLRHRHTYSLLTIIVKMLNVGHAIPTNIKIYNYHFEILDFVILMFTRFVLHKRMYLGLLCKKLNYKIVHKIFTIK